MRFRRSLGLFFQNPVLATFVLVLGFAFAGPGCHTHYHYYNGGDPCAPGTPVSSTVRSGPPCDAPGAVVEGGTTVSDSSARSTTVSGGQSRSSRVVVSAPGNSSPFSWKCSETDSLATTSVQGTLNDAQVNK